MAASNKIVLVLVSRNISIFCRTFIVINRCDIKIHMRHDVILSHTFACVLHLPIEFTSEARCSDVWGRYCDMYNCLIHKILLATQINRISFNDYF
jgi:hypothetical protein